MINLSFKKISDLEESLAMNLLNIQNLQINNMIWITF